MYTFVRGRFLLVLLLTALGAGGYWYYIAESQCKIPLKYDIGTIDSRFNISREEIRMSLSEAESLWEDATGKNLFTYEENAAFKVDFVYDDRQDVTTKEELARAHLDEKQNVSADLRSRYEQVVTEYEDLKKRYADDVSAYEERLRKYNEEVVRINAQGGASPEEFPRLEREKKTLSETQEMLQEKAKKLNSIVSSINTLSEQGLRAVQEYNKEVEEFNAVFGHAREFTQGEYYNGRISIFQFENLLELRNVLAHELGHALSLKHVEDPHAIMYYLMNEQPTSLSRVTDADLAELVRVCGE